MTTYYVLKNRHELASIDFQVYIFQADTAKWGASPTTI